MYVVIENLGSGKQRVINEETTPPRDFLVVFGPASRQACQDFIDNRYIVLKNTETLDYQVVAEDSPLPPKFIKISQVLSKDEAIAFIENGKSKHVVIKDLKTGDHSIILSGNTIPQHIVILSEPLLLQECRDLMAELS